MAQLACRWGYATFTFAPLQLMFLGVRAIRLLALQSPHTIPPPPSPSPGADLTSSHERTIMTAPQPAPSASTAPSLPAHKLLSGQKALVTGANSGIGRGVAVGDEIRRSGVRGAAYKADVSSEDEVAAMFQSMREQFGTVDILVANAGL